MRGESARDWPPTIPIIHRMSMVGCCQGRLSSAVFHPGNAPPGAPGCCCISHVDSRNISRPSAAVLPHTCHLPHLPPPRPRPITGRSPPHVWPRPPRREAQLTSRRAYDAMRWRHGPHRWTKSARGWPRAGSWRCVAIAAFFPLSACPHTSCTARLRLNRAFTKYSTPRTRRSLALCRIFRPPTPPATFRTFTIQRWHGPPSGQCGL